MEVVSLSSSSFSVSSLDSIPMADSISSLVSEDEDEDEDDQMDLQELNERQAKEQAYQRVRQRALSKIVFAPLCWDQSKYVPAKNWSDITDEAIKAGEHIDPGSFSRILDQVLDILGIQEPVDYLEVIKNRKFQVQLDLALEKFRFNYGNGSSRELFTIYEGVENK
jgi:hypothetical protein